MGARFIEAGGLRFAYLAAGPADGPLVLCLHGFPDHAPTWRHLLPRLADAGYHAVAPWMRGYAPTAIPADGDYSVPTLGRDANALHDALGGDGRAWIVGHDWGAFAAYRAAWEQPQRWAGVAALAAPPEPHLLAMGPSLRQARKSWYTAAFQIPGVESRVASDDFAFIGRLWATWSPSYRPTVEDVDGLRATLRSPGSLTAALGYYRAQRTAVLRREWPDREAVPQQPTLYLHGGADGCIDAGVVTGAAAVLPHPASRLEVVPGAGHFLHLEQPGHVAGRLLAYFRDPTSDS